MLLIDTNCAPCNEGVLFYKRLSSCVVNQPDTRLVVISREPAARIQNWLDANLIRASQTVHVEDPAILGLRDAPTIVFVDGRGSVTDVMSRRLSAAEQERVVARVQLASGVGPLDNRVFGSISDTELSQMADPVPPVVLDIQQRISPTSQTAHRATNIPLDELPHRAVLELATSAPVIIDCSNIPLTQCDKASEILRLLDFPNVLRRQPARRGDADTQGPTDPADSFAGSKTVFTLPGPGLRGDAIVERMPRYPSSSLRRGAVGVAVASVLVGPNGKVVGTEVLEAPDDETGQAVVEALAGWVFSPLVYSRPAGSSGLRGKIVFYFYAHAQDKRGVALVPRGDPDIWSSGGQPTSDQAPVPSEMSQARFRQPPTAISPLLIDVRDRGAVGAAHAGGAVNIPLRDLASAAALDLPKVRPIALYCGADAAVLCPLAARVLYAVGVRRVIFLRP